MDKELTPLEIVKRWKAQIYWKKDWGWDKEIASVEKELTDAEKYKKAINIIKIKKVDIDMLMDSKNVSYYNKKIPIINIFNHDDRACKRLVKAEFELLKEIFDNE